MKLLLSNNYHILRFDSSLKFLKFTGSGKFGLLESTLNFYQIFVIYKENMSNNPVLSLKRDTTRNVSIFDVQPNQQFMNQLIDMGFDPKVKRTKFSFYYTCRKSIEKGPTMFYLDC